MSSLVILSQPAFGPPEPLAATGMRFTWEGWDGSTWDLSDIDGGVVLANGVEGLHFPRIDRFVSKSRAIPGHRIRGWRATARDVFWPILIWGDGGNAWLRHHQEFMDTLHPTNAGTWRVRSEAGERSLRLTAVFDDPHAFDRDPMLIGWEKYGVTLEAAQPYWAGPTVRRGPWQAPAPLEFFPGPEVQISSSSNFATARVPNDGDVEAWGVWWVTGPLAEIELGLGGTLIRVPFDLVEGQMLRIDTDPRRPTAQLGTVPLGPDGKVDTLLFAGDDVTSELGLQDYAVIPPRATADLHIAGTGTGSVMFDLTPLYFRAF